MRRPAAPSWRPRSARRWRSSPRYLPKQMSDDEAKAAIAAVVKEINAQSVKDMGKVMAALKERFAGKMDFGKASGTVKALLSGG